MPEEKHKKIRRKISVLLMFITALIWTITGLLYYYGSNSSPQFLKYFIGLEKEKPAELIKQQGVNVPILVYHSVKPYAYGSAKKDYAFNVTPSMFRRQLEFLKARKYVSVAFDDVINYLKNGTALPENPIIISFDDGWKTQYTNALPLLKKYGFKAAFFITTDDIGKNGFLTWDEVKKLDEAGMAVGGHTNSHPFLDEMDDERLEKEISDNKKLIEKNLGKNIKIFAYPFGRYNDRVIFFVKEAGYLAARTTDYGSRHAADNLLKLQANLIFNNMEGLKSALGIK